MELPCNAPPPRHPAYSSTTSLLFLQLQQPSVLRVVGRGGWMRHLEKHARESGQKSVHGRGHHARGSLGITINSWYYSILTRVLEYYILARRKRL